MTANCAECGPVKTVMRKGRPKCITARRIERRSPGCRPKTDFRKNANEKHGVSDEQFAEMVERQNNCCKICRNPFIETPHIDHDHSCCPGISSCGKCVRGLLCRGCNIGIGFLKDDPAIVRGALEYLEASVGYLSANESAPTLCVG